MLISKVKSYAEFYLNPPSDGPLLLPDGKTPDPEFADGETKFIARVPIYGAPDAGRFFWKQMRETCLEMRLHPCAIRA